MQRVFQAFRTFTTGVFLYGKQTVSSDERSEKSMSVLSTKEVPSNGDAL
jgi:hypothetical protein